MEVARLPATVTAVQAAFEDLPPDRPMAWPGFRRILDALPGTVEINAEITAHLARRHH